MDTTHATPELFAALSKAQGEIENASKSSTNPHFKSKYADLAEILNTVRPVFGTHGLSLIQSTSFDGAMVSVTTLLGHASGGYVTAQASCVPAKTDAQGIGSATTYLRRYGSAAMAGIAQEDDDGQAAAHSGKPAPVTRLSPSDGAWEAMDADQQAGLQKIAVTVRDNIEAGDPSAAWAFLHEQKLDNGEKVALWTLLSSSERSALKRAEASTKGKAA